MAVHLTKIYTRTGDDGTTALSDFSRVPKNDARLRAYADCDELNASLGLVLALGEPAEDVAATVQRIQNELFDAGADLATPDKPDLGYEPLRITQEYIDRLERDCDEYNSRLEKLDSFILPGGTPTAALLHSSRTIARRAERAAWEAIQEFPETTNVLPAKYLNRLSDLLFILSRVANNSNDVLWVPGGSREN